MAKAVELGGIDYLDQVEKNNRITWIQADGTVLYDSQVEADTMDNHSQREEVKEALETGTGEDQRYSVTLSEKTMYYAVRLSDGTILRVAQVQETVFSLLVGLVSPVLCILVFMLLLSAFLASGA